MRLNKDTFQTKTYPERVIQFGGGNFLRAFVNWQMQQMNRQGLFEGSAVVVQPIETGIETTLLAEQDYRYTVIRRGILNGETIDESEVVSTISRAINPYTNPEDYLALADDDQLEFIISNTTEAGIAFDANDKLSDTMQKSFPAKLTALLYRRYQKSGKGFTIIPCELIEENGKRLKECVLQYVELWALEDAFATWIETQNVFCDSLVDRIVPGYPRDLAASYNEQHGYEDQTMVICEPYMIWVIQGPKELEETLPLAKAGLNVIVTEDMPLYRERKVHILNGPHTMMSALGILGGLETVGSVMDDADFGAFVSRVMQQEIIPSLSQGEEALSAYAESIKERFRNPFLVHRLDSIMLNAFSKYKARVLPMVDWYCQKKGTAPRYMAAALAALIVLYQGTHGYTPNDDEKVVRFVQTAWKNPETVADTVLKSELLWDRDLSEHSDFCAAVKSYVTALSRDGARAVIAELNAQ